LRNHQRSVTNSSVVDRGFIDCGVTHGRPRQQRRNPGRDYVTDTVLLDHQPHRFYSDLIAGRVVIINLLFINCRSNCPLAMAKLEELQDLVWQDDDNRSLGRTRV